MISNQRARGDAVVLQIRISPKQAERLEKIYRIFGVPKSDVTEIALEEYFSKNQTFNLKRIRELEKMNDDTTDDPNINTILP
ncbi:MAG: hypothetical protein SA339_05075 [Methanomassiliicoccus sp.]|nr:hypothetical protein [Methanomassiliicoccus sp.]